MKIHSDSPVSVPLTEAPGSAGASGFRDALEGSLRRIADGDRALAEIVGGGSDANTTAALGIPSIDGLGPRGRHFHTPQEFAESATFAPKVRALLDFLVSLQS